MKEITELESSSLSGKLPYESPEWNIFSLPQGLNILEIVSLEGEVEDFKDGDDF